MVSRLEGRAHARDRAGHRRHGRRRGHQPERSQGARGGDNLPTPNCASGLALGPSQHFLVGCGGGKPNIIINGLTGKIIATAEGSHGADEVWYNPGDNRFFAPSGSTQTLSVIDADSGALISNLPAGSGVHSVSAFRENNHIFVPVAPPNMAAPIDVCNTMFGLPAKQGCIFVYTHEE